MDIYRLRSLAASEWVSGCVMTIIEEVAQIPWEILPKDPKLRESPPEDVLSDIDDATYFFNNPNDNKGETLNTLLRAWLKDSLELDAATFVKGFTANSYVQHPAGGFELRPRGERVLNELWIRDGGSFLKETDVNGVEYRYWQYSYLHPAVAPIEFDVNEIAYAMRYPRSYSVYGWAEIQSMETVLNCLINSAFTNATMFQEYAVPSGVVSFTGSEEDENRLREYFRTEIKGRFHKVAVLNKEAKFTPLTYTNRDLEFIQGQQWFAKIVWMLYKLTPSELGFTDEIRATGKAMSAQSLVQKRKAVLPLLRLLEQIINNQILNEISDRIVFAFKYADKEQEALDDQLDMQKIRDGIVTINEWRARKKLGPPVPWGDKPLQLTLKEIPGPSPFGGAMAPKEQIPTGPEEGIPLKLPTSADELSTLEGFKAWGGVPSEGYDFAKGSLGGNDLYAAPVLTVDNRTGQVKVMPLATLMVPGRRYIDRQGRVFQLSPRRIEKPTEPVKTGGGDPENKRGFRESAGEYMPKQYVKPTREPFQGPYSGMYRPAPKSPSMVGGRPDEHIRDGMLLPGESPEETTRAREAVGPGEPRARAQRIRDESEDYPMGSLGYRPDEPVRDIDLGQEQTPEQIREGRVRMEYERPSKPFGPVHHTDIGAGRGGPKDSFAGGDGNIGGQYKRRGGGRVRMTAHPYAAGAKGPESTGKVWRGKQRGKEKADLHKAGAGVHRWERDTSNVPVAMATEESHVHIDPHLMKKPYPGRHREITRHGGYDRESRIIPTRPEQPQRYDATEAPADKKSLSRRARRRPNQPGNAPVAPLARARENLDPTGGAGTEQSPRLRPTPRIPRGPKYPRDVPPVQEDTGAIGGMRSTAPSGAKYILQDKRRAPPPFKPREKTDTTLVGPDHRETLGYAERDLSKVRDDVKRSMWAPSWRKIRPPRARKKQVNAYETREEWKGGRLETHLVSAPKRTEIQQAAREGRRPVSSSARAKLRVGRKQFGPKHTHSDAFRGPVKAERSLAKRLKEILKSFLAGRLSRHQALIEGHRAIDQNQARITEIALRHANAALFPIEVKELAPEVSSRLERIRTQALSDFDRILDDANSSRIAKTL